MKSIIEATKLDKRTSEAFGWLIPKSDDDCNRVITQYQLLGSDGQLLNTAFVKNLQHEEKKVPRYVLTGTLLPRPGSVDANGNPMAPLENFVCYFSNYALDMGEKDCDDSWTRGIWMQGEETTLGKQKKTYWYKLEVPDQSFQTQGAAMNTMLDKFFSLHRVLIQYKPGGDCMQLVNCDLTIEELHDKHPHCFDLNDVGKIELRFLCFPFPLLL